jgi:hypothetical protein
MPEHMLNVRHSQHATQQRQQSQRYLLGRSHIAGLLEVEPLSYFCEGASEHTRIENSETGQLRKCFKLLRIRAFENIFKKLLIFGHIARLF